MYHFDITGAVVAYDCGGLELNYTSVSILDVGECDTNPTITGEAETYIQILQLQEVYDIMVYSCKISVTYLVTHCGMHSHASVVNGGLVSKILELSNVECRNTLRFKSTMVYGKAIQGLKVNSTLTTSLTLAGRIDDHGSCKGAFFADGIYKWEDVVVQATVNIALTEHLASYHVEDSKVRLRSGTSCSYSDMQCIDFEDGPTYWDSLTSKVCTPDSYMTLYSGKAFKAVVNDTFNPGPPQIMYTVKDQRMLATLTVISSVPLCHLNAYQTDHPKLLVYESLARDFYFRQAAPSVKNMDLFLYVNSKFSYLEGHIKNSLKVLYRTIMYQKCKLERIVLQNQLSLALTSPSEFAYTYMGHPGYTAVTLGEVVHVIKCTPVDVQVVKYKECVQELPVLYKNKTMFMTPKTHLIQSRATPLTCTPILKPKYKLNGKWFSYVGELIDAHNPDILAPNQDLEWTYTPAGDLMTQGIYNYEDLQALKKQMMYPLERKAIEQIVSSSLNNEHNGMSGIDRSIFLDPDQIKEEIESQWKKFWGGFLVFGNISAGLIGVMLTFKLGKFLIDSIVHGYALYDLYGLSWYLIGCFWDAVTTCLLRPKNISKFKKNPTNATPDTKDENNQKTDKEISISIIPNTTYPDAPPYNPAGYPLLNKNSESTDVY